jgi:hypothetical protein
MKIFFNVVMTMTTGERCTSSIISHISEVIVDNLRAIGILFVTGGVIRSPLALTRIALEASAHVVHLLQENFTAEERIFQVLNSEILPLSEELRVERRKHNSAEVRRLDSEIKSLTSYAVARGCVKDDTDRLYLAPKVGPSIMIDRTLTNVKDGEMWHILSTFIHSLGDEGWRITVGPTVRTERPHRTSMIAVHILHAILVTTSARQSIARYTGWDLSAAEQLEYSLLELWASGSGMRDDSYRRELGLDR